MNRQKIDILIVKLFEQRLSQHEMIILENWLKNKQNLVYFNNFVELNYILNTEEPFDYEQSLRKVVAQIHQRNRRKKRNTLIKYAAIFILLFSTGYYFLQEKNMSFTEEKAISQDNHPPVIINNAIESGDSQAILTLASGDQVTLNKTQEYEQENVKSTKGQLVYTNVPEQEQEIKYNYLTVPRGGQFSIKLSDSTVVWLNSESKLKYPIKFIKGQPRQVELLYGEAYFEVSPSNQHHGDSFISIVNNLEIEVIGTAFNIKAYPDEDNTYTTLAEGTVELRNRTSKITLKPYQQARTNSTNETIAVQTLSSLNELLWRKGEFSFKNKPLKDIMKVLSRWYDMEVVFNSPELERIEFTGALGKEQSIEEIMLIIRQTNPINYEINHKTLTME